MPCQGVSSAAARGCRLLHYSGTMISLFLFWLRCGSISPGLISKNGNSGDGPVPVSRLGTPGWVLAKVCRDGTNLGRWLCCECAGRSMGSWPGRAPKVLCKCCGRRDLSNSRREQEVSFRAESHQEGHNGANTRSGLREKAHTLMRFANRWQSFQTETAPQQRCKNPRGRQEGAGKMWRHVSRAT